jgi:ESS family glutamate:Na+ symporter
MHFWPPAALSLLTLLAMVGLTSALWRLVPALARTGLPASVVAGLGALALGPSGLHALPLDPQTYELLVYHGLAVVFIAFALTPSEGPRTRDTAITAVAIPALTVLQGMIGLLIVLGVSAVGPPLHPGYGQALPMGFSQGPGQAIAMGTSWEALGMTDGGQIALAMAALGYVWCFAAGLPLLAWARSRGWVEPLAAAPVSVHAPPGEDGTGVEPFIAQAGLVGLIYLGAYAVTASLVGWVSAQDPRLASLIWGFHFLIALLLTLGVRGALGLAGLHHLLNPEELRRVGGSTVDLITAGAFAALQLSVAWEHASIILLITTVGGLVTAACCLALGRWAYAHDRTGHALALFGMMTGTLPTSLALLRAHDPSLRTPAAQDMVLGSAGAVVPGIPVLILLVPMPIVGWPASFPGAVWQTLGLEAIYLMVMVGAGVLLVRGGAGPVAPADDRRRA